MSGVDEAVPSYLQPLLPKPVPKSAAVPEYTCTLTRPTRYLPQKLHAVTPQFTQLAYLLQPNTKPRPARASDLKSSDLPKSAKVSLCHLNHQSFLLTTPLYMQNLHQNQVTPPPITFAAPLLHLLPQDPSIAARNPTRRLPTTYASRIKEQSPRTVAAKR